MTKTPRFADVESLWVRCKSGTAVSLLLGLKDGSTLELRGTPMRSWLDAWSQLWSTPPSWAKTRSSRQTSLAYGRHHSGKAEPRKIPES